MVARDKCSLDIYSLATPARWCWDAADCVESTGTLKSFAQSNPNAVSRIWVLDSGAAIQDYLDLCSVVACCSWLLSRVLQLVHGARFHQELLQCPFQGRG